jgi:hypothetical protein
LPFEIEKKRKMQATRSTQFLFVSSPFCAEATAAVHRSDYLNTWDGLESSAVLNESKFEEEDLLRQIYFVCFNFLVYKIGIEL